MARTPDIRFIGMKAPGAERPDAVARQFRVRVGLVTSPGHRPTEVRGDGEDGYAALRDAFKAGRRELEDAARARH